MRLSVRRWGNSLALRIPKALAAGAQMDEGTLVDLSLEKERLVVVAVAPRDSLSALLARVTDSNLHGEVWPDPAIGREAW